MAVDIGKLRCGRVVDVVFDVGANFGQSMSYFAKAFPSAGIYCFEPVASTFSALSTAAVGFPKVRAFNHGMGDHAGDYEIFVHGNAGENSLMRPASASETASRKERVLIRTIDSFCEEQKLDGIDLLKIDVEGFELQVLAGAERMLRERRVDLIYSEAGFDAADKGHTFFPEIHAFMQARGFELFAFYDPRHWRSPFSCEYADVLYVSREMKRGGLSRALIP